MDRDFDDIPNEVEKIVKSRSLNKKTQLWVVGSGKGGVGKTFITSSLGITLSKLGHSVVIVDLDVSGANIHTTFGIEPASLSIRSFFEGDKSLQECVIPTPLPHLSYVQGFWDTWTVSDCSAEEIQNLIKEAKSLKADIVLFDIGAGATKANLELIKAADEKIIVSTPEPTSIEKTYRFIESIVCSHFKDGSQPEAFDKMLAALRKYRQVSHKKPFSFRNYAKEHLGIEKSFFDALTEKPIRLVINTSRSQGNETLGYSMKSVCNKYYDLNIDYTGAIDYDNAVWQSIRGREHALVAQPFTPLAGQFLGICKHIIDPEELRAVV